LKSVAGNDLVENGETQNILIKLCLAPILGHDCAAFLHWQKEKHQMGFAGPELFQT
jgi:hypothetical protein